MTSAPFARFTSTSMSPDLRRNSLNREPDSTRRAMASRSSYVGARWPAGTGFAEREGVLGFFIFRNAEFRLPDMFARQGRRLQ